MLAMGAAPSGLAAVAAARARIQSMKTGGLSPAETTALTPGLEGPAPGIEDPTPRVEDPTPWVEDPTPGAAL